MTSLGHTQHRILDVLSAASDDSPLTASEIQHYSVFRAGRSLTIDQVQSSLRKLRERGLVLAVGVGDRNAATYRLTLDGRNAHAYATTPVR